MAKIISLHVEHRGLELDCSPLKISDHSTLRDLMCLIGGEIGEAPESFKLKRRNGEAFPDEWKEKLLGMQPIGINDKDILIVELLTAGSLKSSGEASSPFDTVNVRLKNMELSSDEQITSSDNPKAPSDTLSESLSTSIKSSYQDKNRPLSQDYPVKFGDQEISSGEADFRLDSKKWEGKRKLCEDGLEVGCLDKPHNKRGSQETGDFLEAGNTQENSVENYLKKSKMSLRDDSVQYENTTSEDEFEDISCSPGESKTFLDNTAKISCAQNHSGCKFRTRFTPHETFEEICELLLQENFLICGPMVEIRSIIPANSSPPHCFVSLRHYLSLPTPSHVNKSNYQEKDNHFVLRVTRNTEGNWQIFKIKESILNLHSVTWNFNEFSHVLCAGNLKDCEHPFHLSLFFLRLKSDEQENKCEQKKVEVHLVVRHVDASDNKENWDDPETIEKTFKQKYMESQEYVEAATPLPITIPGGGQFSLVVGLKEGLIQSLGNNSQLQLDGPLFERCGTISIQSLAKEKGAQLVWRMDNPFPYRSCELANLKGQDTRASLRAETSEKGKYVNPEQLFQKEGTGMALTITSCPCKSKKMERRKEEKSLEKQSKLIHTDYATNERGKEFLLEKSIPLLDAFKKGDVGLADFKKLCNEMGLMDRYGASLTSIEEKTLSERTRQMISRWHMKRGKEATIEALIEILNTIELRAISENIECII